jgi:hypothetical protein
MKKSEFDWEAFKKYVDTYVPGNHGANDTKIIIEDMLYGLGLSIDKKTYAFADGYDKFKTFLKELIWTKE